ncbi:MAG TPA: MG2 domain-containing protein [Kofleriaceae bacterium]|nr:MG2 domain-containing protein [Kofleriaceae bacterium]
MTKLRLFLGAALLSTSCAGSGPPANDVAAVPQQAASQSQLDKSIAAMTPAKVFASDKLVKMSSLINDYFQRNPSQRSYVMTDKPLYQPGETIWFRADLRATGSLVGKTDMGLNMMLMSPRGSIVAQKRVLAKSGVAQNDFALSPDIEGGEYTIQLTADDGTHTTKKIIVNTYEAPRLKKSLELLRKAYGEGDQVSAAIEIKRATGEAFADKALTAVVTVDDIEVARVAIKTDASGGATAKFQLPAKIARGDGLLTILADDGGVTESIQKRIPIVMKTMQLSLFPEGGDLVEGVAGRVYFMAKNTIGKPADIEGKIVDDRGQTVTTFASIHDGLGRFELAPDADRTYHVEITKPAGITQKFDVPAAKSGGCVVRSVDDSPTKLRVAALCSSNRTVMVEAVLREKKLADGAIEVQAGKPALIELPIKDDVKGVQGATRVTLFSAKQEPLAERLVYHGKGQDLKVELTADKKRYSPRDPVKLKIKTTDPTGKPVKANVGVAVVDDTVLSFADDKSGRMLSKLYLEPELGATDEDPIEEPNFYFGDKPEAVAAMDALLATRGYRKFEWQPVLNPPPPVDTWATSAAIAPGAGWGSAAVVQAVPPAVEAPMDLAAAEPAPQPERRAKVAMKPKGNNVGLAEGAAGGGAKNLKLADRKAVNEQAKKEARWDNKAGEKQALGRARMAMDKDEEWGGEGDDGLVAGWSPVRVFPVPEYKKGYEGPRTDFRETIYWNASVDTSSDGTATVSFPVSDAVTSFRAIAEGVSAGGVPGGGEAVIQSKMPLALDARLPVEVTSGDSIRLPVSLTNETDDDIDADLTASFGAAFKLSNNPAGKIHLRAGEKKSLFFPLEVVATDGEGNVSLGVRAAGLDDKLEKKIRVVPLGFPFELSASGTAAAGKISKHELDLSGALPGSITATVNMYPSPLASMTKGMEAMIREPGGCFEQTSSSNYPNIMVLSYLATNDAADAALVQKTQGTLDRGYKLLTGYETKQKGYEWFGQTPGHEALTAYGLMEFADMAKVYDVDHAMVERTADWLMSRRDGKGGFLRSSTALDSFGRASEATTNAYIMWALGEAKRTKGLDKELAAQKSLADGTKDPYLLALATNTALLAQMPEAKSYVQKLVAMQGKDGSFDGAKESITMSGGESLDIETTSLATLAMIKASPNAELENQIRRAVDWLNTKRSGYGQWSNTQATILGLKALNAYSEYSKQMQASGSATLIVNGVEAGTIAFEKGRKDALVWKDFASKLKPGKNTIEVKLVGQAALPYSIAVDYRAARPQSSNAAKVTVTTQLAKDHIKLGEGVKLRARVENTTKDGLPMTLARVGIPGGLTFQTWQLKELRDKGAIDFYETRPREVILYWRALAPSAKKDIDLDLLAATPGTYEAPATSAYLYYTAEDKAWTAPVKINVEK